MLRLPNKFKKQTGISLLEVMLSLSIIAIILVMATRYFFVANDNSNVNKLRGEVSTVVSALQEYRNQNPDYSAATMAALITGGFIAQTADVNTTTNVLNNPWSSPIALTGPSATSVTISTVVPTLADCNALKAGYPTEQAPACSVPAGGSGSSTFTLVVGSP